MARLRQLIHEIHRRSLWQVMGIYVAGSWLALQVVDLLVDNFGLPAWLPPFALTLLVIGLPVVLATAVVQEGVGAPREPDARAPADAGAERAPTSPSGSPQMASSPPVPASRGRRHRLLTWRNALLGGAAAGLLWGGVAIGWLLFGRAAGASDGPNGGTAADARRSIAVLPFTNRSADEGEGAAFFAGGIHDDLLTQLSKIDDLKVISRTSVLQYEGTTKPIRQIAEELDVATVLEGGVQRAGQRVRVNVQLIDPTTDAHLWAETYDEALTTENIFAIQSDIAHAIARALETRLAPEVEAEMAARPTESLEAYDLYSQARYLQRQANVESHRQAIELYRQAIASDPAYARAHAALASAYVGLLFRGAMSREEALASARPAVERALELDPDLAEVHVARGQLLDRAEGDYAGAERAYRRAIELNPALAEAHASLGALLMNVGRFEEARAEFRRSVEVDPLSMAGRANLAFLEFIRRDYEAAEAQATRIVELAPGFAFGHYILGAALTFQERHQEAIAAAERAVELNPDDMANLAALAFVHARAGHRERALELSAEVEARGGPLKEVALVFAALGEVDRAFEYLERAYTESPGELDLIQVDPSADPLRSDPRFAALLERLDLD